MNPPPPPHLQNSSHVDLVHRLFRTLGPLKGRLNRDSPELRRRQGGQGTPTTLRFKKNSIRPNEKNIVEYCKRIIF